MMIETLLKDPESVRTHLDNTIVGKNVSDYQAERAIKWKYLSMNEKMKLFNPWCIAIMIANMFQLVGASSVLFSNTSTLSLNELVIGLGCFGAWLTILRFIDTDQNLYSGPKTIKTAAPKIFNILVGVFPVFIGFGFLGLCLFWRSDYFKSPSDAFFTLFSMMYGDALRDIYTDVSFGRYLAANLFCYSFIFFAI
jgi:hypothetical protein